MIPAIHPAIAITGRVQRLNQGAIRFGYPGVELRTKFAGRRLALRAHSTSDISYLDVQIDGQPLQILQLGAEPQTFELVDAQNIVSHQVSIMHRSETWHGLVTVEGFETDAKAQLKAPRQPERKMLIIGDSVTCGEAIDRTSNCQKSTRWWNPRQSYGLLTAEALEAQVHLVCYGGRGLIRSWNGRTDEGNAPEFFEQTLPGAQPKIAWDHDQYHPDLILVALGTNDFSLGIGPLPLREFYVSAYRKFIQHLRVLYPDATIALTEGAIVNDYADPERPQKTVLRRYIAETVQGLEDSKIHFVPASHFPGDECDAHPTKEQHHSMADELAPVLGELMDWR